MTALAMRLEAVLERLPGLAPSNKARGPLPNAIDAEVRHVDTWSAGKLAYYVDDRVSGRPVVLLHAIDAAASSREMAPLFNALRGQRPVYALDLPGYGLSDRSERAYDRELFRAAVRRFLTDVVRPQGGTDVIALSLSSEFAAAVACEEPSLVRSLVLLSPTGLGREAPGANAVLRTVARLPLVAQGLFRVIASPPSVRWFLGKSFVGQPDPTLVDYAVRSAKEPGAYRAPLAFLSGALFTPDAFSRLYANLSVPTLIVYDEDPYSDFERLDELVKRNPIVKLSRVSPTRGLPQFEQLDGVLDAVRRFWSRA